MTMAQMIAPRLAVVLERDGQDTEYTVQTDNRDLVRFDLTRGRKGWPGMQDAPILWMTFLAWSALAREGVLPGQNVEVEIDMLVGVNVVDEDGNTLDPNSAEAHEAMQVGPTPRAS